MGVLSPLVVMGAWCSVCVGAVGALRRAFVGARCGAWQPQSVCCTVTSLVRRRKSRNIPNRAPPEAWLGKKE